MNLDRLEVREEARTIAKATTAKKTRRAIATPTAAPAPVREPRVIDPNKPIAIAVDPETRARVEHIWQKHNELSPVPATKSAIYRAVLAQGVKRFEEELQIKPATV